MKYYAIEMLLLITLVGQSVISQSEVSNNVDTLSGKKGLVFTFSGLNLGGGLGGKYWLSSSRAIRIQITGGYFKYSSEDYSNSYASLNVGLEKHFEIVQQLSPYVGGSFGYSWRDNLLSYKDGFQMVGFIGIEFWTYHNITLSGEQNISFSYSTNLGRNSSYSIGINTSTSSLLLSIYF
ncbi:MAG: hypothetical protein WDA22_17445 [Bacteroidota bacterium]